MILIDLIRHAKTLWNLEKRIQGRTDPVLCPLGIEQAEKWAEMLNPRPYDLILSSPMTRAWQTAQIISAGRGICITADDGLREQDFGKWEGRRFSDINQETPGMIQQEEANGWNFCPPDGESRIHVLDRSLAAMASAALQFSSSRILVVCHNSVIKTLVYHALKRQFLPGEPKILSPYGLHELAFDTRLSVLNLNCLQLPE